MGPYPSSGLLRKSRHLVQVDMGMYYLVDLDLIM